MVNWLVLKYACYQPNKITGLSDPGFRLQFKNGHIQVWVSWLIGIGLLRG
jgi:hypothetical protein